MREGDHYRLSGRWPWASGSINCQWLMGGSAILEDGKPRLLPNGMLDSRLLVFPTAQATLIDSWFAAGLCGTGSGDMEVRELRVPVTRSVSLVTDRPVEGGPLYVFPVFGLLALGIGAVALGIARAAITDLVALAGGKKPQGSTRTLAERATAQTALAEAEARLRAARAFFTRPSARPGPAPPVQATSRSRSGPRCDSPRPMRRGWPRTSRARCTISAAGPPFTSRAHSNGASATRTSRPSTCWCRPRRSSSPGAC